MSEVAVAQTKDGEQEVTLEQEELDAAAKAEERLAAIADEPEGTEEPAASKTEDADPTPPAEEDPEAGKAKDDSDPTPAKSELPDKYRRAAIHQGWEPEEVDEFVKKDPELALKTLEKLYVSTNKISQEFARIGRGSTKDDGKKADETPVITPIDLTAMKKAYGDDDPAIQTIQALQDQVALLAKNQVPQKPVSSQPAPNDVAVKTINSFFGAAEMEPYAEFYGKGKVNDKTLTIEQYDRRRQLLETADQIRDGAALQGIEMDVDEALERAHLVVADEFKSQALRTTLKNQLKTKSKGATLKPKGTTEPDLSKTNPAKHLEDKTTARLAAIKW